MSWFRCVRCGAEFVDQPRMGGTLKPPPEAMQRVGQLSPCKHCPWEMRDPCVWCPSEHRPISAYHEAHARAEVIVGAKGQWRLCRDCAALPRFRRFRVRREIRIERKDARYQEATYQVDNLTLYGRLRELSDQSTDTKEAKYFAGELLLDNGEVWRVRFKATDKRRARELWSKPVYLMGQAFYYRATSPKIVVREFGADDQRDYEAAFDELYGLHADLYGTAPLTELLSEIRGTVGKRRT